MREHAHVHICCCCATWHARAVARNSDGRSQPVIPERSFACSSAVYHPGEVGDRRGLPPRVRAKDRRAARDGSTDAVRNLELDNRDTGEISDGWSAQSYLASLTSAFRTRHAVSPTLPEGSCCVSPSCLAHGVGMLVRFHEAPAEPIGQAREASVEMASWISDSSWMFGCQPLMEGVRSRKVSRGVMLDNNTRAGIREVTRPRPLLQCGPSSRARVFGRGHQVFRRLRRQLGLLLPAGNLTTCAVQVCRFGSHNPMVGLCDARCQNVSWSLAPYPRCCVCATGFSFSGLSLSRDRVDLFTQGLRVTRLDEFAGHPFVPLS